jgi:hypothetical protein
VDGTVVTAREPVRQTGAMSETRTVPDLDAPPVAEISDGSDDPDAAHIVSQKDLMHSQITGEPIRALCGKLWVPKRNPDDYPLCSACVEIFNAITPQTN